MSWATDVLRRLTVVLGVLITILVGCMTSTPGVASVAEPMRPPTIYTYDGHGHAVTTTHVVSERGLPAVRKVRGTLSACLDGSRGVSVRPWHPRTAWTYDAYDHAAPLVWSVSSRGTTRTVSDGHTVGVRMFPGASVATKAVPETNKIYSSRVLTRMADEPGPFHNFPGSFDDTIFSQGGSR